MPNVRDINENKYKISKARFRTAYYFCLQYPEWKESLEKKGSVLKAQQYSGMPSGSGGKSDPTANMAEARAALDGKMRIVEECAMAAVGRDEIIYPYLMRCVTSEGTTYKDLRKSGLPVGQTLFYSMRRMFYYLVDQKIN